MDPATLAVVSLGSTVLGTGASVVGGIQQAEAQADASRYQAQVARNNQIIADQNARYAVSAGEAQAQAQDMKNRALVGGITAAQGASGIDLGSTTSREVRESAEQIGRLNTETIFQNAMLQARGYQAQGANFGAQSQLEESAARNASRGGTTAAFSSLLSGASSFSDKWLRFRNVGVSGFTGTGGLY